MACLDSTKPTSSGEAMNSLCNCRMENPNKSFGTLRFTLVSASAINKVSWVIGDWRTFEFFIIESTASFLNGLLIFLVLTMHGLIGHFTDVFLTWATKCPRFVEAFLCWRYALDLLRWSKSWIELTSLWSVFSDGYVTMDTILDMKKVFCPFDTLMQYNQPKSNIEEVEIILKQINTNNTQLTAWIQICCHRYSANFNNTATYLSTQIAQISPDIQPGYHACRGCWQPNIRYRNVAKAQTWNGKKIFNCVDITQTERYFPAK